MYALSDCTNVWIAQSSGTIELSTASKPAPPLLSATISRKAILDVFKLNIVWLPTSRIN